MRSLLLLVAIALSATHVSAFLENCNKTSVDFIVLEGDATSKVCFFLFFSRFGGRVFVFGSPLRALCVRVRVGVPETAHVQNIDVK
jgi:hypothetical protein